MEKTFVLIKPDAVERNLIGKIVSIYEDNGLVIDKIKKLSPAKEVVMEHYMEHKGREYFEDLISYIMRSEIVAISIEGENAISRVRAINGPTNPKEAGKDTIRGRFALSKNENSIHASDSKESAKRELSIWFPEE